MSEVGWTTLGNERIRTIVLVERMRQFRGRLSKAALISKLGYDPTNNHIYQRICHLCAEYAIATASANTGGHTLPPEERVRNKNLAALKRREEEEREQKTRFARQMLKEQIALGKAEIEAGSARPYKAGNLEW